MTNKFNGGVRVRREILNRYYFEIAQIIKICVICVLKMMFFKQEFAILFVTKRIFLRVENRKTVTYLL